MNRKSIFYAALLVFAVATAGNFTMVRGADAKTVEVKVDNYTFTPGTLTVPVNTTITWVNHDDVPHTIVSSDGVFKSKALDTDDKYSYTFTKAGTYPYYCGVHPRMTGKIVVR
jgi:plastocyanin